MKKKAGLLLACLLLGVCISMPFLMRKKTDDILINDIQEEEPIKEEAVLDEEEYNMLKEHVELWKENKKINGDYKAQLVFESKIIDLPVVQGLSNETYLRTNWIPNENGKLKYDIYGTPFFDYTCNLADDENLIIYGHFVYPSLDPERVKMFTPLHQLKEEENYDDNKIVYLILGNEVRKYEVAYVYYCDLVKVDEGYTTNPDLQYYWNNYSSSYFGSYIKNIKKREFYDTGVEIEYRDEMLTLQTCVQDRDDLRLIVVSKLIDRYLIETGE